MKRHLQHQYLLHWPAVVFIISSLLVTACDNTPKSYTIGVINSTPVLEETVTGFKAGMAELGYIEGENITYIYNGPTSNIDELEAVAQELVTANVDLILSVATPATQAAQRATVTTKNKPIVFVPVTDPVGAGLVDSLRQPGGNSTGVTFGLQEGRRLEWLVQVAPTIEEIYAPYNPVDQSAVLALQIVQTAAAKLGVKVVTHPVHTPEEAKVAMKNIPEEIDAVFLLPDSLVSTYTPELLETATRLKLPVSGANSEAVRDGMLTSYGIELHSAGKQAARLADQIFKGVKPADLPVETAEFYLAINLKTAKAIELDISDEILRQADIIIR